MMKRGIEQYEFVDKDQNRHLYIEGDCEIGKERIRRVMEDER
jgi:hypothetical protein